MNKLSLIVFLIILLFSCKSINNNSITEKNISYTLEEINDYYVHNFKLDEAKEKIESYIKKNQNDPHGYFLYYVILYELNNPDKAIEQLEIAVKLENNNEELGKYYYNLGNYYHNKNIDKALSFYEKSIKYNENIDSNYYMIGVIYYKKNQIDKCVEYWKKYILISKNIDKKNKLSLIIKRLEEK